MKRIAVIANVDLCVYLFQAHIPVHFYIRQEQMYLSPVQIYFNVLCNKKAIDFLLFSNYKLIETSIAACEASNLTSSPPTKCNNLPLGCNLAKIALAVAPKVQLIASKVQLIAPKLQLLAPKVQLIASRVQLLAPKQYRLYVR